jgi:hypothetical protein
MARRLQQDDAQALLNIRTNLINAYAKIIDADWSTRSVAQCKQSDVDAVLTGAIKSLEEVLTTAADINFK